MMKTMKRQTIEGMVSTVAAVMVMAGLFAPAAMAEEVVRDHRDGSEEASPIVRDHRDDSTSTVDEEEPQMVCIKAPCPGSSDSTSTVDEEDSAPHEPQVVCIKAPCPGSGDSSTEEEPYKDPGIRQCDITPVECEGTDGSGDSGGVVRDHRDDGSKDEEAASAPGGVKVGVNNPSAGSPKEEAVSGAPADEAGQEANGGTVYGCAYDDYYYDEETDMCWPNGMFLGVLFGDEPWPESAGGYVSLLGDFVQDPLVGTGLTLQAGLGYVGDALVEFGDTGNFVGWPFQGLGYTLGFLGDVSGALGTGLGEAAGAVADGVGEVVDAIGDAAGAAYDEIASWF